MGYSVQFRQLAVIGGFCLILWPLELALAVSAGGNSAPTTPGTPSIGTTLTNATSLTWNWSMSTDSDGTIADFKLISARVLAGVRLWRRPAPAA